MKTNRLTGLIVFGFAALALQRGAAQPLDLSLYTTGGIGVYTNTFDSLGYTTNQTVDGTPGGARGYLSGEWVCFTNATANYFGIVAAGAPSVSSPGSLNNWTNPFGGNFYNYASYYDYIGQTNFYTNGLPVGIVGGAPITITNGVITDPLYQTNEPNRCLGIRQTGAFGDPGAAIVIKLANTLLYDNFRLYVDLINLDPTSPRQTTWLIQYGVADPIFGVPAAFQTIPGTLASTFVNVPGSNHWKKVNINIPNGTVNNIDGQVWLRIFAKDTSINSGNRETFAIDNFGLTWTTGNPGCVPATNAVTVTPPPPPVYSNATVSFSVSAPGQQPLYYQWRFNGMDIDQVFPGQILYGSQRSSILTLANITPANEGTYSCLVSNVCNGTVYTTVSPGVFMAVSNVQAVSLGYLRTLSDPNNGYTATASPSQFFQVTGMITTVTNTTTGNTASYYIQDATGGMNLFVTWGSAFRPAIGDEVTAAGYLNTYQGNLELEADLSNSANYSQVLSNNIANYPVAKVLDWATEFAIGVTNRTVEQGTTNGSGALTGLGSKKGSICLLRDVYFGTNAGRVLPGNGNYSVYVTNAAGQGGYVMFWSASNIDVMSNTIPAFAYCVQGPLFANVVATAGSFWSGIGVSKWSDVVTTPLIVQASWAGNKPQLTWTAVPQTYSYSVLAATSVTGPYNPVVTGLKFSDANGNYTDLSASGNQRYYRVTSP